MDFTDLPDVIYSSDDEELTSLSSSEIIQKLKQSWLNEKFADELLPNQQGLVDQLLKSMNDVEEDLSSNDVSIPFFHKMARKLEIDRLRYMVTSYLRIRINKINRMHKWILEKDAKMMVERRPVLSAEEFGYARELSRHVDNFLQESIIRYLPSNLQQLSIPLPGPAKDLVVIIVPNEDLKNVKLDETSSPSKLFDLLIGVMYLVKYELVSDFVKQGKVQLL
ncbi:hypothetical protein GJ496_004004 [Pomphorhynchus laevis]|nr:hypothetical protein GJ496_004004 [Pomphorhynchus laevis]